MIFAEKKIMKGVFDSEKGVSTPKRFSIYPIEFNDRKSGECFKIEVYIDEVNTFTHGVFASGFLLDGDDWYRVTIIMSENNKRNTIVVSPSVIYPAISNKTFVEYFDKQTENYPNILDNIKKNPLE